MRARLLRGALSIAVVATLAACAPRSGKTHFDRWAEQTQKRKDEEALEAKEKEWLRAQVAGNMPVSAPAQHGMAPASQPRGMSTSPGMSNTPPIASSTAAKSRVIRPADSNEKQSDDDEAIY